MKQKVMFVFIIFIALISIASVVKADTTVQKKTFGGVMSDADKFLDAGKNQDEKIDELNIKIVSTNIYNALVVIAIITSIIIGAFLGIKLIVSGTVGKAEVKEVFIPYLIGNAVAFGAFAIWKIVVEVLNSTAT